VWFLFRPTAGYSLEAESETEATAHISPERRERPLDAGILHNLDQHDAYNEIPAVGGPAMPHFSDQHFRFGLYINARRNSYLDGKAEAEARW